MSPNVNDYFPSNFIKATDLNGTQPVVTIDRVTQEPVGQERLMKPIVYFVGKEKGLVLNKTNSKKISDIAASPNTDDWNGVQIKLYATDVEFQGETVTAIRVKSPLAREAVKRATVPEEDIPF